jgi:hypothetical protein
LGGMSMKEILHEMDQRMPTILQAVERYDASLLVRHF